MEADISRLTFTVVVITHMLLGNYDSGMILIIVIYQ